MTGDHPTTAATGAIHLPTGARQLWIGQAKTRHLPLSKRCNSSSPVKDRDMLPVLTPGARVALYLGQNKREPTTEWSAPEQLEEGVADAAYRA